MQSFTTTKTCCATGKNEDMHKIRLFVVSNAFFCSSVFWCFTYTSKPFLLKRQKDVQQLALLLLLYYVMCINEQGRNREQIIKQLLLKLT